MSKKEISRRDFLKYGSGALAVLGAVSMVGGWFDLGDGRIAMAASGGYIVVDTKKCQGCNTCTMTCSLAHHGIINLSLGRIQIKQNSLKAWPDDIKIDLCHQCTDPACVKACPTGANHLDPKNGNVRTIDERKCMGCQQCIQACPYGTLVWNHIDRHAQKCDLCANTPFWNEQGGIGGKQACVSVCPVDAVKFTTEIPSQILTGGYDNGGYDVNLRKQDAWEEFRWGPVDK